MWAGLAEDRGAGSDLGPAAGDVVGRAGVVVAEAAMGGAEEVG